MDRIDQLIELFRTAGTTSDAEAAPKLHAVVQLEELIGDARVVPFLESVVADTDEHDLARIEALKVLRLSPPPAGAQRRSVGRTIATALWPDEDYLVRQYAASALGPYAADATVFEVLSEAVLHDDDIDVRHNALDSVREAGNDSRTVGLLRRLSADPELGRTATRILHAWTGTGP